MLRAKGWASLDLSLQQTEQTTCTLLRNTTKVGGGERMHLLPSESHCSTVCQRSSAPDAAGWLAVACEAHPSMVHPLLADFLKLKVGSFLVSLPIRCAAIHGGTRDYEPHHAKTIHKSNKARYYLLHLS